MFLKETHNIIKTKFLSSIHNIKMFWIFNCGGVLCSKHQLEDLAARHPVNVF